MSAVGSTRKARKRAKQRRQRPPSADDGLRHTVLELCDAAHALIDPQPHPHHTEPLPCRYTQLRQALYTHHGGNGNHTRAHTIPASIDALKYVTEIDALALVLLRKYPAHYCRTADRHAHTTIRALHGITTHRWHPGDPVEQIRADTHHLKAYTQKIDDLFAPKPVYLPNACPRCGQHAAHKLNDEGETCYTPALAVTIEHGATCQHCHDNWAPDQLQFLGRLLGYQPLPGVSQRFLAATAQRITGL